MAQNKTQATDASVDQHIAAISNDAQRSDCLALLALMRKITKLVPRMWGPSIVGFGSYHYKYESKREGDAPWTGFAARGNAIAVYLVASSANQTALLATLGKHKMGKSCLTIRRLSDVDAQVLEQLVAGAVAEVQRRYG